MITDRTRHLCPALTSGSAPYFVSVPSIEDIPANHFVAVKNATRLSDRRRQWLREPRAEEFYDIGPIELGALSASSEQQAGSGGGGDEGGGEGD